MAYFRNTAINLLNLHYGIHATAQFGGGAFYLVFMLKQGISVPLALVAMASILAGRFLIRPAVLPLAVRFGLRPLLVAGTLASALQFPFIAEVDGTSAALFAFCAIASLSDTFYWTTYHAYFASLGDAQHRGHQLGLREAVVALVGIVSPLLTAWALVTWGPRVAFGMSAVIQLAAALPLFLTPNVTVAPHVPGAFKAGLRGTILFITDGWIGACYVFVWQLALFLSLGESFMSYGGALAIAALVGAAGSLVLGRHIDAGHGGRAVWIAGGLLALTILLRGAAVGHATLAIIANALGALVAAIYTPTLMTAVYNLAKASPCALRFHVATEGGWDAGGSLGCLVAALLIYMGAPLGAVISLALLGVAASSILLRRYYAGQS